MDRLGRVLRRVERRLEAPEPERSRILMEVAGDLDDLYRAYRERGLDEAEARRRAERWLAPSAPALESLGSVHLPAIDRLLERLSGTTRGRIELGLVTLASTGAVAAGAFGVFRSGILPASAPGLWIVAGLVAAGIALAGRQAYPLFVRGDRLRPGWRRAPDHLLAASAGAALAGGVEASLRLTLIVGATPDGVTPAAFWSQLSTASTVAALGLGGSLLLALLWLLLRVRAEVVGRARAALRETVRALDDESTGRERETAP